MVASARQQLADQSLASEAPPRVAACYGQLCCACVTFWMADTAGERSVVGSPRKLDPSWRTGASCCAGGGCAADGLLRYGAQHQRMCSVEAQSEPVGSTASSFQHMALAVRGQGEGSPNTSRCIECLLGLQDLLVSCMLAQHLLLLCHRRCFVLTIFEMLVTLQRTPRHECWPCHAGRKLQAGVFLACTFGGGGLSTISQLLKALQVTYREVQTSL